MRLFIFLIFFTLYLPINAQHPKSILEKELKQLAHIELLPQYRTGRQMAMISSFDTTGGNDDGFSGKYSFIRKEGANRLVMAELEGPGIIHRIWTPTPTEDTIQFYFDGEEEPRINIKFQDLFSAKMPPFSTPLVGQEVGGYYNYVPIPYEENCKIVYVGDGLKFFQIQYSKLNKHEKAASFSMHWRKSEQETFQKVASLWNSYRDADIKNYSLAHKDIKTLAQSVQIRPGENFTIAHLTQGGRIIGIELDNAKRLEGKVKDLILQANWDDEQAYAIHAPVADFFGYAFGKRAMQSLLLGSREDVNYCFIPMPFDRNAVLKLYYQSRKDEHQPPLTFHAKVFYTEEKRDQEWEGKLYTVWRRAIPKKGAPYTILRQQGKGHHIGTILLCQSLEMEEVPFPTGFFEGDDVTTIDGEVRMHGTGSEDYFNGGWYGIPDRWDIGYSLPLHGSLDYSVPLARTGGFRFKLSDKVPFEKSYELTIEHGPEGNEWEVDYQSISFYYGDTPPQEAMEPSLALSEVPQPDIMEIHLNFFDIKAFGFNAAPSALHYSRLENKEVFILQSDLQETSLKIDLNVPVEGVFDLYLSYFQSPESGQLRLFQRQQPLSEWINLYADTIEFVKKRYVGRIAIKDGISPMTIHTKGHEEVGSKFLLHRIYLKKADQEE